MNNELKKELMNLLEETHTALRNVIVNLDLGIIIHQDSGWRGREILSHIGAWDREVAMALREFLSRKEYLIPDYGEDHYNDRAPKEQKNMSTNQVVEDWKQARKELIEAINLIPADRFPGDLLYPWGDERGSIYDLVKYFCDHEIEHEEEIEKFMKDLA